MMKKILIFIIVIYPIGILGQCIECFTHPLCGFPIALFSMPSAYACIGNLDIPGEAGYEVEAVRAENGYILLSHPKKESEQVWVRIGDIGVVIQNYNNYSIPVYSQPDSLSTVQTYLLESYIGILYNWHKICCIHM